MMLIGVVAMTSRGNVRTHTRRTASGKTTTVHQHTRRNKGRKGIVSPAHAWKLAKSALRAARRKRRVTAAVLGGLAVAEVSAWLTLRGVGLVLATAGVLAIGVASMAAAASGWDGDRWGGRP
jgi:hypothetical protein